MNVFASKIVILIVSDSHKHYATAIDELKKRLGKQLDIITLKPQKGSSHTQIIQKETQLIFEKLEKYSIYTKVLLEKGGKQLPSLEFATHIYEHPKILFVIGGPYGVDVEMLRGRIDMVMSFGLATLPHGLCLLLLVEQLWRAKCIVEGREYHY